jgi:hypothetical protein
VAARDAVETSGQFNIIHPDSGLKIDVYVNPDTPYDRAWLARLAQAAARAGVDGYFARPEDVILRGPGWPRRLVVAERHRGPCPARRRLGEA